MPSDALEFDTTAFRSALGRYPTGVALVTTSYKGGTVAIAANSFASVSLEPPLLLWCIGHRSSRHPAFISADRYVISVLAEDHFEPCEQISRKGATTLSPELLYATKLGPPAVVGALVMFECDAHGSHDYGDHTILIGSVVRFSAGAARIPLVFHCGRFRLGLVIAIKNPATGQPMQEFTYNANPGRVLFGSGTLSMLPEEVERLGLRRVVILTTRQQEAQGTAIAAQLGGRAVGAFADATMHTPVEVTEQAMALVAASAADGVIAIGGGSTIGLGKAIALRTDLSQIVIPTTYAGSEMTPILGETRDGAKVTQSTPKVLPEVVIYDVDLTLTLPAALSGVSGINAMAHAIEALYAKDRNPITTLMALEAIGALYQSLPKIAENPTDAKARTEALYGAWLCGTCLGAVGMSLHHKLCHTLGGSFDLPHAETHAAVLPHALAYNAPAVPEVMERLAEHLGSHPAQALYNLALKVGAQPALRGLGMLETGIDIATDRALANPYWNPRPLNPAAVRELIASAWAGTPPQVGR